MATQKKTQHEVWAEKAVEKAKKDFEINVKATRWEIKKIGNDVDACVWEYELPSGRKIGGSFTFANNFGDTYLSLATGIGIDSHPHGPLISTLLYYIETVSSPEKSHNTLGDYAIRGWLWHMMVGHTVKDLALPQLLRELHVRENIDDVYKAYEVLRSRKHEVRH